MLFVSVAEAEDGGAQEEGAAQQVPGSPKARASPTLLRMELQQAELAARTSRTVSARLRSELESALEDKLRDRAMVRVFLCQLLQRMTENRSQLAPPPPFPLPFLYPLLPLPLTPSCHFASFRLASLRFDLSPASLLRSTASLRRFALPPRLSASLCRFA